MTVIITDEDVERHLSMTDCIKAMETAFLDFSSGDAVNLPRARYQARHPNPEQRYFANVHVGAVPSAGMACVRAGSQIITPPSPTNNRRLYENPRPFCWGIVILFDIETAEPLALMHEFQLSGMRVGATSGMAVNHMAPEGVKTLGLYGTGKQASSAFDAITSVRDFERGVCTGFIDGFAAGHHAAELWHAFHHRDEDIDNIYGHLCVPKDANRTAMVTLFVRYLEKNSDKLKWSAGLLLESALREGYPCEEKN